MESSLFRRLRRLDSSDRILLIEALVAVTVASAVIRFMPFRQVAKLAERPPFTRGRTPGHRDQVRRVAWAVRACATRLPWKVVCFQQGLAVHLMLRRRSFPSILNYGITQSTERGLEAHVWVTEQDETVIGGEEAGRFTCIATFPSGKVDAL